MAVAERGLADKCSCLSDTFSNRYAMSRLRNNARIGAFAAWRAVASSGFQSQCAACCACRLGFYAQSCGRLVVPKAFCATDLCTSTAGFKSQACVCRVCGVGVMCLGVPPFQAFQLEHWGVSIRCSRTFMYLERRNLGRWPLESVAQRTRY